MFNRLVAITSALLAISSTSATEIKTQPREIYHNDFIKGTYYSEYVEAISASRLVFDCQIKIDTSKWSKDGTQGFWFAWGYGPVVEDTGHIDLGMCEYRHHDPKSKHYEMDKMPHCHDRSWDGKDNYTDDSMMDGFFPLEFTSDIDAKGVMTMDIQISKEYGADIGSFDHNITDGAALNITFLSGDLKYDKPIF